MRLSLGLVKILCVESNSTILPIRKKPVFSATRAACCMLWVTITIVYCDFSSKDQVFDLRRRDRIERRRRLIHQQHFGIDRQRARNAQPLLLAAGEAGARLLLQIVLHFFPQRRLLQRPLHHLIQHAPVAKAVQPQPDATLS